jgi:amidase
MLDALWQIGPLARYIEDLNTLLPIIAGVDWRDTAIVPMPLGDAAKVDLKALRVAFHADNGIETPTRESIETVENAARALEASVAAVEGIRPPGIEQTYEIYLGLFTADGGAGLEELLEMAGTKKAHPLLQRALELQRSHATSMAAFGSLMGQWDAFRRSLLSFMERFDVIVCPVCSFPGMVHGSTYDRLPAFSYTMTYNLTGWPAAVVRGGSSREGLPIGVQIVARPWREDVALAVAAVIEKMMGGFERPPL